MREGSVSFLDIWTPRILSVLRIITAFMFIAHGTQKLFNAPPATMVGVRCSTFTHGHWRSVGICRRSSFVYRTIYSSGCIYSMRRNGGCLFYGKRAERISAAGESR